MRIRDVKFASGVIEKLMRKHHLTDYEVREVFANSPLFRFAEKMKMYIQPQGGQMQEDMLLSFLSTN